MVFDVMSARLTVYLPAAAGMGRGLPSGQYRWAPPHGNWASDVDPAGQKCPSLQRPEQAGDFSPGALPKRPAAHCLQKKAGRAYPWNP